MLTNYSMRNIVLETKQSLGFAGYRQHALEKTLISISNWYGEPEAIEMSELAW